MLCALGSGHTCTADPLQPAGHVAASQGPPAPALPPALLVRLLLALGESQIYLGSHVWAGLLPGLELQLLSRQLDVRQLTDLVYALAQLHVQLPPTFLPSHCSALMGWGPNTLLPAHAARLLWSHAQLGHLPPGSVLQGLLQLAVVNCEDLGVGELSDLVEALMLMRLPGGQALLRKVLPVLQLCLEEGHYDWRVLQREGGAGRTPEAGGQESAEAGSGSMAGRHSGTATSIRAVGMLLTGSDQQGPRLLALYYLAWLLAEPRGMEAQAAALEPLSAICRHSLHGGQLCSLCRLVLPLQQPALLVILARPLLARCHELLPHELKHVLPVCLAAGVRPQSGGLAVMCCGLDVQCALEVIYACVQHRVKLAAWHTQFLAASVSDQFTSAPVPLLLRLLYSLGACGFHAGPDAMNQLLLCLQPHLWQLPPRHLATILRTLASLRYSPDGRARYFVDRVIKALHKHVQGPSLGMEPSQLCCVLSSLAALEYGLWTRVGNPGCGPPPSAGARLGRARRPEPG